MKRSESAHQVRRLDVAEADAAIAMLTRAFATDPLADVIAPDRATWETASRWCFTAFLQYGLRYGEVWTVGALDGVAIWWAPPYVEPDEARAVEVGLMRGPEVLGPEGWERFLAFGVVTADLHHTAIQEPHWYLNVIGVSPDAQGTGVGSALLASMFARLDRDGLPAYLDTGTDENAAYYERRGFTVAGETREPSTGMLVRGLRRDPQTA